MTLKEYIARLEVLAKKNPKALVIYSRDDEGNGYQKVNYEPCLGNWDGEEFDSEAEENINAACIN